MFTECVSDGKGGSAVLSDSPAVCVLSQGDHRAYHPGTSFHKIGNVYGILYAVNSAAFPLQGSAGSVSFPLDPNLYQK